MMAGTHDEMLASMLRTIAALPMGNGNRIGLERQVALYRYLCALADSGRALPENKVMRRDCGFTSLTGGPGKAITHCLKALERRGLITVHYGENAHHRRVRILASGKFSGWQCSQEWWGWAEGRQPSPRAKEKPASSAQPDRSITFQPSPLPAGLSDYAIYGHLAEAVRACRRAGDVVYRNPANPPEILINGRPGDPKERIAWHARHRGVGRAAA